MPRTHEERQAAFLSDLRDLLSRHRANLDVTDDGASYGMHSAICEIYLHGQWNEDGTVGEDGFQFKLPPYMTGSPAATESSQEKPHDQRSA